MKTVVYVQGREFFLLAKRDELLSSVIGNNYFGMVPFRWPSREFDQVVALSKEFSGGVRLKPTFEFPKGVVDKMRFFDVSPLALCSWSDDDQEWARRKWDSLEFCKDGQYIKVYDEFHVSGLRPAYRKITSVDGPSVYLLSKDVVDAFHAEDFSGLDLGPVYDSSATLAYEHHCLLVARNFLPPFIANPSVKPHEDSGEMAWAVYGFLTYDPKDLVQALDFNRTREATDGWNSSRVIVSQRVRTMCLERKYKGWRFRPVIEMGAPAWTEFDSVWRSFCDQIAANPMNKLI